MRTSKALRAAAAAALLATTLAGCTLNLPFVGEVELPDPPDLSGIGDVLSDLPGILGELPRALTSSTGSIEEYEEGLASERTPLVSTPAIHEDGVLSVGIDFAATSAPMAYREADGTVRGIDAELAYVLGDALGLEVRFVDMATQAASADIIMDVALTAQGTTSQSLSVVGSYLENAVGVFYKGTQPLADAYLLEGKRVGVQLNSVSHAALQKASVAIDIRTYSNLNDAFAALDAGELDYVSCPAYPGAYLAVEYPGIICGGTLNVPTGLAIAVSANNSALSAEVARALEGARSNGLLDLVRARWVGSMATLTEKSQLAGVSYVLPGVTLEGALEAVTPMGEPTAGANAASAPPQTMSSSSGTSTGTGTYSGGTYGTGTYGNGTYGGTTYDNSYGTGTYDGGGTSYDDGSSYDGGTSYDGGSAYDGGTSYDGGGTSVESSGGDAGGSDAGL